MVSEQMCRDWDANAVTLGNTPKLDAQGKVIPIGVPEDPSIPDRKRTYYVVWVGCAVGLFHNWGLVSTLVSSFSGNAFKAFVGLEVARTAWENGPAGATQRWVPPRPGPSRPTPGLPLLPHPDRDYEDDDSGFTMIKNPTRAPPIHVPIRPEDYQQLQNEARAAGARNDYLLSPTPSTASLLSVPSTLSTPSWMSSSTLSPRTVSEPDIVPSMSGLSIGERYTAIDGVASRKYVRSRGSGSASRAPDPASGRAYMLTPTPVNPNPNAGNSGTRILLDKKQAARRARGDPVFVVVRGEYPGVYFDNEIALLAAGYNPAMKIIIFKSLKLACFYFVQQYMAGKVGVPVFVVPTDGVEEAY